VPSHQDTVAYVDVPGLDLGSILQIFLIGRDTEKDGLIGKQHREARSGIGLDGEAGRLDTHDCSHGLIGGTRRLAASYRDKTEYEEDRTKRGKNTPYIYAHKLSTSTDTGGRARLNPT
jgi:hypothetical protein